MSPCSDAGVWSRLSVNKIGMRAHLRRKQKGIRAIQRTEKVLCQSMICRVHVHPGPVMERDVHFIFQTI